MSGRLPRNARRGLVGLVGLIAIVTLPYFACDHERTLLDDAHRPPGSYAALADGATHYALGGPERGLRVVLVHGASGPMSVWDPTFEALIAAGLRVLRYDLYGRGLSDRPAATYDEGFYQRQLDGLLAYVGWSGDGQVSIVGSSMGAIVAARFATTHPVRSVVLIGPAGFPIDASPLAKLLPVPGVGDWAMTVFGDRMLAAHNRKYYLVPREEADAAFRAQLAYRGYKRAVLSTMRAMPMNDFSAGYRALGQTTTPILILWGKGDRTFPFANAPRAQALMPRATLVPIDDAAHVPQYERPDQVAPRIVEHVRASAPP